MEKATIKLQGGMGNYLFQIACLYAYSLKNNKKPVLSKNDSVVVHKKIDHYISNILSNSKELFLEEKLNNPTFYNEPSFHFSEIPTISGDVYLNGYFQTDKYFKEFESEIRNLFSYPKDVIEEIILKTKEKYNINMLDNTNYCSIHIRRGDYLNSPNHHPVQNMNYYTKAIKQMPKDSVFLIFSDDIAWCKQNFPDIPEKFIFIEGFHDYEDLFLMKLSKNNIICNSTFSWWGAFLNENPEKVIISPIYTKWFGNAYSHYDTKDIIPNTWIQLG